MFPHGVPTLLLNWWRCSISRAIWWGLDRVLFGSEHTLCDPGIFVAEIRNINLFAERYHFPPFEEQDIRRILGENAARVYGIEAKKRM